MRDKDIEINIEYEKMVWREVVALNKKLVQQLKEAESVIDEIYEASKNYAVTKFGVEEMTKEYKNKYKTNE